MARRSRYRTARLSLPALLLLALLYYFFPDLPWEGRLPPRPRTPTLPSSSPVEGGWQTVRRVVDGDTLLLENGERVRLIGVDTPETKHPTKPVEYFGKEAAAFTARLVEGKRVRLEYDGQGQDRYERTLAYVFLEDGTLLNAEVIKQGYGHAYTKYPFARLEEFRRYEREAREAERGLWAGR